MKRFCLDTSGFSNPLGSMPFDLFEGLWVQIIDLVEAGAFATTTEIHDELVRLEGEVGDTLRRNRSRLVMEVADPSWDWPEYVRTVRRMQADYAPHISEWIGGKRGTVGLNDISIVALARTLNLPLVSMEVKVLTPDQTFRRTIPNLCEREAIEHLGFNDLLRRTGIRLGR